MSTFQNFTYRLRRIGDGHFGFYLFQVCTATYYYYNNAQWPKISVLKKLEKFKVNQTTWHIGKNCILWIQGMLPFFLIPLLKNWLVKNWTIPEKSVFKDNSLHFHFLEWYSNFCWGLYLKDPYWVLIATQYSFEHVCIAKTFAKNSE